jgi:hypothetical protein
MNSSLKITLSLTAVNNVSNQIFPFQYLRADVASGILCSKPLALRTSTQAAICSLAAVKVFTISFNAPKGTLNLMLCVANDCLQFTGLASKNTSKI